MPQFPSIDEQNSPAARVISRFGVPRLAIAMGRTRSVVRRLPRPKDVGGQEGLLNIRQQIAVIELAIAEGEPLELAELFPSDLVARLQASNDRISASEEEAA